MDNKNLIEDIFSVISYVGNTSLSQAEANAISFTLRSIAAGNAERITTDQQRTMLIVAQKVQQYFKKHPSDRIMLIGDIKIPREQINGIATYYGIRSDNLSISVDYDKLKKNFPFELIESKHTIAIILGSMPHSVAGKGEMSSPVTTANLALHHGALSFTPKGLKITKEFLRDCFQQIAQRITDGYNFTRESRVA